MRNITKLPVTIFLLCTIVCGLWTISFAAIPKLINYQGRLTDSQGRPITGQRNITFRLYESSSGGTIKWQGTYSRTLDNGIFSVMLGENNDTNYNFSTLPFDVQYWLGIQLEGDTEMKPLQLLASSGYAIRANVADDIAGVLSIANGGTGQASANSSLNALLPNQSGNMGKFLKTDGSNASWDTYTLPDNSVTISKLKTATAEYMGSSGGWNQYACSLVGMPTGNTWQGFGTNTTYETAITLAEINNQGSPQYIQRFVVAGGEYCFLPQCKLTSGKPTCRIRYVTSSGKDHWLFLLLDKMTKKILAGTSAPDHPSYGNGGDSDKLPHPFLDYDASKHDIVLIDKESVNRLKKESQASVEGESILSLVVNNYRVDYEKEERYQPLHSGKYLMQDGKQVMYMIENIPDYIKVRRLVKLTK